VRKPTRPRRAIRFATALLLPLLVAADPLAARAATHAPTQPAADAIAHALLNAYGAGATVDDSSTTQCMGANPIPLAYRTDRVILRPSPTMTTADAMAMVSAVLRDEMGPGTFRLGTPDTITWDAAADPGAATPAHRVVTPADEPIWRAVAVPIQASSDGHPVPVVRLARRLRGLGVPASPDYLLEEGSGPLGVWPDGPPSPAPAPQPPRPGLGGGVSIAVYDTGALRPGDGISPPNLSRLSSSDVEEPDRDGDGIADVYYTGHLTAIAGVLEALAPGAAVTAIRITGANDVATEFGAAKRMVTTLKAANNLSAWPEVLVSSWGSPVCDVDPTAPGEDMVPLGLQMVSEAIDRYQQAVVVAAAGNVDTDRRFYPGAFGTTIPSVIAVGALDAASGPDGDPWASASRSAAPADFSNFGDWVAAWAPGTHLATYQVTGLRFEPGGDLINGYAYLNGTSVAAPYVGGLVAEQIARTGESPLEAWQAIRSSGRPCSAAVGGGTAVALTALTATATTAADPARPAAC
jgi:hypothetical protein